MFSGPIPSIRKPPGGDNRSPPPATCCHGKPHGRTWIHLPDQARKSTAIETLPRQQRQRRHYGKFYWPLALSGLVILLEGQFQNAVLARYPNAEVELSIFALATSSFQLINALLVFIPQMVAVMGRHHQDRLLCRNFAGVIGLLLSLPMLMMGFTATGADLLAGWLNISPEIMPQVVRYLQWLAPLVFINAKRHYYTGVLVLSERTRTVTLLNVLHMFVLVGVMSAGLRLGWAALPTLALATVSSNVMHFFLGFWCTRQTVIPPCHVREQSSVTVKGMLVFFWPLAATSMFFAMSRPVLYSYINLTSCSVMSIAALRVGFDFCHLFQNPVNQFRHVYVTYGERDPVGVRNFMFRVTAGYISVMLLTVFTPVGRLFFGRVLGLEGEVLLRSIQVARVLTLVPGVLMMRNLYHGKMMVGRNTTAMAIAAFLRVVAIGVAAKLLLANGLLNHVTGALAMLLGFVAEAVISRGALGRCQSSGSRV